MSLTTRNLWVMALLIFITGGLYTIYWLVATKIEINNQGGAIPSAWLIIIPLANIYFLYKFAEYFSRMVLNDASQQIGYFILLFFITPIAALICQAHINTVAHNSYQ